MPWDCSGYNCGLDVDDGVGSNVSYPILPCLTPKVSILISFTWNCIKFGIPQEATSLKFSTEPGLHFTARFACLCLNLNWYLTMQSKSDYLITDHLPICAKDHPLFLPDSYLDIALIGCSYASLNIYSKGSLGLLWRYRTDLRCTVFAGNVACKRTH